MYQVIPFMTHLELNHIKDDKLDSERAHKGQEAVKLVNAGLQPQYRGRFKLQVHVPLPKTGSQLQCVLFSFPFFEWESYSLQTTRALLVHRLSSASMRGLLKLVEACSAPCSAQPVASLQFGWPTGLNSCTPTNFFYWPSPAEPGIVTALHYRGMTVCPALALWGLDTRVPAAARTVVPCTLECRQAEMHSSAAVYVGRPRRFLPMQDQACMHMMIQA